MIIAKNLRVGFLSGGCRNKSSPQSTHGFSPGGSFVSAGETGNKGSPKNSHGFGLGRRSFSAQPARRAALTVELILVLPVFLILLVAVVQFGLYHVRMQHVALASRIGAEQASQTSGLPSSGAVPQPIVDAVAAELQSAGITQFCIRLEHNVNVSPPAVLWYPSSGCPFCSGGGCTCCPSSPLSSPPYSGTNYVRLSVCVPLTQLMPNVLKVFGFDLTGKTTAFTTVFRYEL
ncbi:MAG: pilus assembly protein [Thermoguttaceae bacterium]|nr:pilus assembly protein [Thermoguttaceae bacterium]